MSESDLDDFQHATSILFCLFFLPENMHRFTDGFFQWILWGFSVCFASHSHLGSVLFHVVRFLVWLFGYECAGPDDVFECSLLKYTEESEERIQICNSDWRLLTPSRRKTRHHARIEQYDSIKTGSNQTQRSICLIIFVYLGLARCTSVNLYRMVLKFSFCVFFSQLSSLFHCHVALPSWQFWSYEVVHGVHDDQSDLGFTAVCRSLSVEPWRAVISDDRRDFGSYGESGESRILPENV